MTFHGESIPVEPVFRTTGDYVDGLRYRAGSASFADGESFRAWAETNDTWYLWADPSTPVVVSWVVEVAAGSGTLTLAEGTDPDGGFGSPPATGTALGAHSVTGPQTLVVASVLFDGAYVLSSDDSMVLRVDVTGGTVEVQQVKLRVWPTTGALGGWSPTLSPSWAGGISAVGIAAANANYSVTSDPFVDGGDAWDAAWAEIPTLPEPGPPYTYTTADGTASDASGVINTVDLSTVSASLVVVVGSLVASPAQPGFPVESGVDYLVPPNEVRSDPAQVVQQVGSATREYFDWELAVDASSELPLGDFRVHSEAITAPEDISDVEPVEVTGTPVPTPAANSTGRTSLSIPEPDIDEVLHVSVNHLGRVGSPPAYPAGIGLPHSNAGVMLGTYSGDEFTPATSRVIYPPYRVWTLDVAVTFMRVMQRGDGLGMGSGRVFNQGTRQGSSKVFGTY